MRSILLKYTRLILVTLLSVAPFGCKDKTNAPMPSTPKATAAEVGRILSEAEFALQMKEYSRAETLVNQVISLEKDDPRHYMSLGYIYIKQGNKSSARTAYEKALKYYLKKAKEDDKNEVIHLDIMNVYLLLRQPAEAQKVLDAALKQFPNYEDFKIMQKKKAIEQMMQDVELQSLSV